MQGPLRHPSAPGAGPLWQLASEAPETVVRPPRRTACGHWAGLGSRRALLPSQLGTAHAEEGPGPTGNTTRPGKGVRSPFCHRPALLRTIRESRATD